MKRILVLEPYYGGSHKYFLDGLQQYIAAEYVLFTLPARNWQMKMQLAAPWFVEQIKALSREERRFSAILCSSFVDVAVMRGLLNRLAGWDHTTRILTYFHENQFAYPKRFAQPGHHFFAGINFHSALASDALAFNSRYNQESFFDGCRAGLKAAPDMKLPAIMAELAEKSRILHPGVIFSTIDGIKRPAPRKEDPDIRDIPVIVWNHRWEHDKNPESFFAALDALTKASIDFRLIVLGQSFPDSPACFFQAEKNLQDKILHFGFARSYNQYLRLLSMGDIVVSSALHEFYGISIIEAVRAGCWPILPNRLSYPELFDGKFLYNSGKLTETLGEVITKRLRLRAEEARLMTEKFGWQHLKNSYTDWLWGPNSTDCC